MGQGIQLASRIPMLTCMNQSRTRIPTLRICTTSTDIELARKDVVYRRDAQSGGSTVGLSATGAWLRPKFASDSAAHQLMTYGPLDGARLGL